MPGSDSLFELGDNAARIYFRYSKVHPRGRSFFGLREIDLGRLEGHNSFICLLLDDAFEPLFIPYADFEEIFRRANAASDGQYKVQLFCRPEGSELYIARQGRFNVEGYVGLDSLAHSLDSSQMRLDRQLSHSQVQTLLAAIGRLKGFDVYVPMHDHTSLDWSLCERFRLSREVPSGYQPVAEIISEVDVVWTGRGNNSVHGLFEVEHSTPVYSGLLRFNDILLTNPNLTGFSVVSNDGRRGLFTSLDFHG